MSQSEERSERFPWGTVAVAGGWGLTYVVARGLLELEMAPWLRVVVAVLPIPVIAFCLVLMIRGIGQMDELQKRIHLEALAVAYPLALLLLMTLGLLELAVGLKREDWSYRHVWPFLTTFYFLGLAIATKRYQSETPRLKPGACP